MSAALLKDLTGFDTTTSGGGEMTAFEGRRQEIHLPFLGSGMRTGQENLFSCLPALVT